MTTRISVFVGQVNLRWLKAIGLAHPRGFIEVTEGLVRNACQEAGMFISLTGEACKCIVWRLDLLCVVSTFAAGLCPIHSLYAHVCMGRCEQALL